MSRARLDRTSALRLLQVLAICVAALAWTSRPALAQEAQRPVRFEWDESRQLLFGTITYRDVVDANVRRKLTRGLPTTIVMTGTIFRVGVDKPVATTAQTCKVTWHVWEEAYKVDVLRPGSHQTRWTTTLEGVLRRCAEARDLLVATKNQVSVGAAIYMRGKIQVNPLTPMLLDKIKRWVSRPSATGTAGPGDALFGTFTGLFLQRIGEAEKEVKFTSPAVRPPVRKKQEAQSQS